MTGANALIADLLEHDPGTLGVSGNGRAPFLALYSRYTRELRDLMPRLIERRERMREAGLMADFSDTEGMLLYMATRELRPATVVEISPAHGYSTNYILAAMAKNGTGACHSFEIEKEHAGTPIGDVIASSLLPELPRERLHVHVGDVRSADPPAADLLFIDSSHEDHFAAWLFQTQVPRARIVLQHDIVTGDEHGYRPKAWYLGAREQAFTLESLHRSRQRFFAAAAARQYVKRAVGQPPTDAADRSILFAGHALSTDAAALADITLLIHEQRLLAVEGLRDVTNLPSAMGFAERCAYGTLLAEMGYRRDMMHLVPRYDERVRPRPPRTLSTAEVLYYVQYLRASVSLRDLLAFLLLGRPACSNARFASEVRRHYARRFMA